MACEHQWTVKHQIMSNWIVCEKCTVTWPVKGSFVVFAMTVVFSRYLSYLLETIMPETHIIVECFVYAILYCIVEIILNYMHYFIIRKSNRIDKWIGGYM